MLKKYLISCHPVPVIFQNLPWRERLTMRTANFKKKWFFYLVNFWAHKDRNHSHSAEPLMFFAVINKDWGDWIRRSFLNTWIPFLEDLIWRRHQLSFDTRGLDFFLFLPEKKLQTTLLFIFHWSVWVAQPPGRIGKIMLRNGGGDLKKQLCPLDAVFTFLCLSDAARHLPDGRDKMQWRSELMSHFANSLQPTLAKVMLHLFHFSGIFKYSSLSFHPQNTEWKVHIAFCSFCSNLFWCDRSVVCR